MSVEKDESLDPIGPTVRALTPIDLLAAASITLRAAVDAMLATLQLCQEQGYFDRSVEAEKELDALSKVAQKVARPSTFMASKKSDVA